MSTDNGYTILHNADSIRLFELTYHGAATTGLSGRLLITRLSEQPQYDALSYVWGTGTREERLHLGNDLDILIGKNLFDALTELASGRPKIRLWADQICINQRDDTEKEQQVRLMSQIFSRAQRVIGWLGNSTPETHLALKVFGMLGLSQSEKDTRPSRKFRRALRYLRNTGHLEGLFDPSKEAWRATASFVQMAWFHRLWIVQEVLLASNLELRCGNSTVTGEHFFAAVEVLSSTATDPPNPLLLEPYRNALKLAQLRKTVSRGKPQSYPHLARTLSGWRCVQSQDRLNALHGILFRNGFSPDVWFKPRYDLSGPQLYENFATSHIGSTDTLEILHFAGCGNGDNLVLSEVEDGLRIFIKSGTNDVPSWVPDWRIRTRPLVLLPNSDNELPMPFRATMTPPTYFISQSARRLQVCAREVDEVIACGLPYCDIIQECLNLDGHQVFSHWYSIAEKGLGPIDIESMFASTLLMGGRVRMVERQQIAIQPANIMDHFNHWAPRNLDQFKKSGVSHFDEGLDKSTHFAYQAATARSLSQMVVQWALALWALRHQHLLS